ncbi:MAG: hypothetical protein PVI40_01465 [Chlamydiota bacterium]|jgi:hypothetical protein
MSSIANISSATITQTFSTIKNHISNTASKVSKAASSILNRLQNFFYNVKCSIFQTKADFTKDIQDLKDFANRGILKRQIAATTSAIFNLNLMPPEVFVSRLPESERTELLERIANKWELSFLDSCKRGIKSCFSNNAVADEGQNLVNNRDISAFKEINRYKVELRASMQDRRSTLEAELAALSK